MQNQEPQNKPKLNRMTLELVVMMALFFGIIMGLQTLQSGTAQPKYDPMAVLLGPVRFIESMRSNSK